MKRLRLSVALTLICLMTVGMRVASQTAVPQGKLQRPEPIVNGVDLFSHYCAVCHGVDAKGDGPLAPHLKSTPANLTVLASNNRGQFPAARVRSMIAGDDEPGASHGTRTMPVWGPIFRDIVSDQVPADVRLSNLTKYLESIQQKQVNGTEENTKQ